MNRKEDMWDKIEKVIYYPLFKVKKLLDNTIGKIPCFKALADDAQDINPCWDCGYDNYHNHTNTCGSCGENI